MRELGEKEKAENDIPMDAAAIFVNSSSLQLVTQSSVLVTADKDANMSRYASTCIHLHQTSTHTCIHVHQTSTDSKFDENIRSNGPLKGAYNRYREPLLIKKPA